ncbi:MAG: hypothetical protein Q3995_06975 [Eubacteriales bacterium]|nr:hypothetical protein [Eubacteriales bacterium]
MERELLDFLCRVRSCCVTVREAQCELRLLSAREMLALRRTLAPEAFDDAQQRALFANASLLSRALYCGEETVFPDGETVLETLGVGEINALIERYAQLDAAVNPSGEDGRERIEALKKA